MVAFLLLVCTLRAANRFESLIGSADIAASLAAAWTVAVLCEDSQLGRGGRNGVIAGVVAILTLCMAKALIQYFIEGPDTAQFLKEHFVDAMRGQGLDPNDPVQKTLFLSRAGSREVTGFGAYSNVFATEMIALVTLLVGMIVSVVAGYWRSFGSAALNPQHKDSAQQVLLLSLATLAGLLMLGGAAFVLGQTHSNGAIASSALGCLAVVTGTMLHKTIVRHRKGLLIVAVIIAALLPALVILYGRAHSGLPTKSLLFRWQYWSATVPILKEFPVFGTGLNNFGDYYLRFKAPSSPEDVKDPHSFFIRLAVEAGIPAAMAIAALLFWFLSPAFATVPIENRDSKFESPLVPAFVLAIACCLAWIPVHMLTFPYNDFDFILTFLFALFGFVSFACAHFVLTKSNSDQWGELNGISLSVLVAISVLAMLLYDQINMALVTGPCAMLFWVLLGASGSASSGTSALRPCAKSSRVIGTIFLALGIGVAVFLVFPLARNNFAWDPAPHEFEYIRQFSQLDGDLARNRFPEAQRDLAQAYAALDRAIVLSPNNGELYMQRIALGRLAKQKGLTATSIADDIRKVFFLDRANARIRMDLAMPDSDLPAAERVAALKEALAFDRALPADEPKRLTVDQIKKIDDAIAALEAK